MADNSKQNKKLKLKSTGTFSKSSYKWVITIIIWTFAISTVMQTVQAGLMNRVSLVIAFIILFSFILIGIIFDIIGVASTSASETPFHSLSSKKVRGAKEAVKLIRSADKVSNFCNDVIGDISGIISGSAVSAIVILIASAPKREFILTVILTAFVAALTVGGKAFGKSFAISNSNNIIFTVAKIISFFSELKSVIHSKKKKNNNK